MNPINSKNKNMKKTIILMLLSLVIISMPLLKAQDNTQLALDIAKTQEKNREQLMNYSWQRSAKGFKDGEEKIHMLVKVWFNSEDKMESSVLSSESSVKKQRGVRGKMQQNKGEDLTALLEQTINLSIKYVYLSKGNWIDLTDNATVKLEDNMVKIDAKDLLVKGDQAIYVIDNESKLIKSINVSSMVDEKTFTSSIDFKTMNDGTNHPGRTVITIPSESMKITAENIDYIKQQ